MQKKTSLDRFVVRSRRTMIYTFLLILVFTYIGAKAEMRRMQEAQGEQEALGEQERPGGQETLGANGTGQMVSSEKVADEGADMVDVPVKEKETSKDADDKAAEKTEDENNQNLADGRDSDSGELAETSPVIDKDDMWALILTNARYPIPEDYSVELKVLPGTEQSVDERIYDATVLMISDMKKEGLHPIVCSAYRTLDRQEILFNRKVNNYVKRGYSMEDAYKEAQHVLSIPGSGEHCLGLAVDIFSRSYQKLEVGFENTKEGKWLREHCAEYGFILRYDSGKEGSTGINYEPWHFRYVGKEVAEYIMEKGISLEEFYIEESLYG